MTSPASPAPSAPAPGNYTPIVTDAMRLIRVLFSPGAVFEELREAPRWAGAWIVVSLVTVLINILNMPFQQRIQQIMMERANRPMPAGGSQAVKIAVSFITTPIVTLIIAAIMAAVLYMLMVAFTSEGGYKKALTIVIYSWPVVLIQQLLTAVVLRMRGVESINAPRDMMVSFGVDLLLPADMQLGAFLRLLLAGISPLLIWSVVIIAVGLMVLGKAAKGSAYTGSIIYCLITLLITSAIFSFLFRLMGG